MWSATIATAIALFGSQVAAGIFGDIGHVLRRDDSVEAVARQIVDLLSTSETLARREAAATTPTTGYSNMTQWLAQTNAACIATLSTLNGVSTNPSGLELCYNIVSLNQANGSFYADLRIYQVAPPTGAFATTPAQNVQVAAQFTGATVQTIAQAALQRREDGYGMASWPSVRRTMLGKRVTTPVQVQSYALFGILNMTMVTKDISTEAYEKLLTPTVVLSATVAGAATKASTTLPATDASFIQGVFSSNKGIAQLEVIAATTANMTGIAATVNAPGVLFRMPGTKILILPIGGFVTGTWVLLMLTTIGYGTIGRINFREQFRRRSARAAKGSLSRI